MSCWTTLGIEEGSDKKTIKSAYAKLLKVTKPDDDPQGFQELHAAYKEAIALVSEHKQNLSPQWFTPPNVSKDNSTGKFQIESFANPPEGDSLITELVQNSEHDFLESYAFDTTQEEEKLKEDWELLTSQTKQVIKTKAGLGTIDDWHFIEQIASLIDLEFRSQASDLVFKLVSDANRISLKRHTLLIKEPVLNYLNSFFHWNKKWQYYEENYAHSGITILRFIKEKNTQKRKRKKITVDSVIAYSLYNIDLVLGVLLNVVLLLFSVITVKLFLVLALILGAFLILRFVDS